METKLVCGLGEMTISASLAIMMEEKQSHALAHIMQIKKISIQPLILMLLRLYHICGIEYADLLLMAHPNLLGTTNKNLLKSVTSSDGWTENYSYEIDKEGYPTKIIVTETNEYGSSYNDTYTLIWQ